MGQLTPLLKFKWTDDDGNPLVGGKVYTYVAGTSTPLATYTDESLDTENANPVILDSRGEADIWIGGSAYKFIIKTSADSPIATIDDVESAAAATISNDSVSNAKLVNMATQTIKGRTTAGTGDPEDLTATQATAILNAMVGDSGSGGTKGLAPAPASGDAAASKFLKADGTWAVPSGSGLTALTGDVAASGSGSQAATIASDAVTFAKMQNIATDRLVGRDTASSGDPEEISVSGGLEFSGSGAIQRSALTGDVTASAGSNSTTIANDAVTNAKAADMAAATIKGRASGAGTGDPTDLTGTQATAILDAFVGDSGSGGTKGLVPAPITGDSGKYLKGNGTWASVTATSAYTYTAQTTTYSAAINDFISASSSSFTITLPTAVGVSGQKITILHAGTSLTQVYTLATTSSQTIGGIAGGSYALYTNGEYLVLVSDGANWQIEAHKTETAWSATATTVYTSSAASPVTPGTATTNTIRWMRRGQTAIVQVYYKQTATATANSGTYGYRISMPANMQNIATSITGTNTIASGQDVVNLAIVNSSVGGSSGGGTLGFIGAVAVYDTTTFRMVGSAGGTFNPLGATLTFGSGNNAAWFCTAEFPIDGWQP
jgi:hypothetical protein